MGFNFVETVLSDGLCLISDGKGGDCLWANVFQLSAFCFFAWKNQKHQHNRHYHRCARTAEGKASVACVSRGCAFGKRALFEILYPRAWLRDTPYLRTIRTLKPMRRGLRYARGGLPIFFPKLKKAACTSKSLKCGLLLYRAACSGGQKSYFGC